MIEELIFGLFLALLLFALSPFLSWLTKKYNLSVQKSLALFVTLAIIRLTSVAIISLFLFRNGGNIVVFLLTFATAFSVLLLPEVIIIGKFLKE